MRNRRRAGLSAAPGSGACALPGRGLLGAWRCGGDLGRPNLYVPVPEPVAERSWELLHQHFVSQRSRDWFDRDALLGLALVRGVECHRRHAQAFRVDKMVLELAMTEDDR